MEVNDSIEPAGAQWDYFLGGVPPLSFFDIECGEIRALVAASDDAHGVNISAQLAVIGLVAFFEGFCRALFSAAVNICPNLLDRFCNARPSFSIPVREIIAVEPVVRARLGFLAGAQLDFGNPKAINSAFRDLLCVSPLSTDEAERFDELLRIRNLVVHYGGVHATRNEIQDRSDSEKSRLFVDSVACCKNSALAWADFLSPLAAKANEAAHRALVNHLEGKGSYIAPSAARALELLAERLVAPQ